ncbi:DUF1771-domain-containing protein [Nemania sp. FL0031]|nr:DUF1771-domain-containing protein [Nemania sp. FL0031]
MSAGVELGQYADRSIGTIDGDDFSEHSPEGWRRLADAEHLRRKEILSQDPSARDKAKLHADKADIFDKKASDAYFKMNNSDKKIPSDMIDLHGQQVDETKRILRERIPEDQGKGHDHLHVIVGQAHHSKDHIGKLKPAVEKLCEEFGLRYNTEENQGRIYIDLRGGRVPAQSPTQHTSQQHGQYQNGHQQQPHPTHQQQHYATHQQQHYPAHQQQHYNQQNQEEEQYDEVEKLLTKLIKKYCCTVM